MSTSEQNFKEKTLIEEPEKVEEPEKDSGLIRWLRYKNSRIRFLCLAFFILVGLGGCAFTSYFCIYTWLPQLWNWGFTPLTWRCILSIFGVVFLISGGLLPFVLVSDTIDKIIGLYAEDAEMEFIEKLDEIDKRQNSYEDKLETNDELGLIPLVTYSRIELEQYYKIGLTQTQKSYSYSIISMWIGFVIIIFGILLYLFPNKITGQDVSANNFHLIAIGSGIVTEFISALFLWIYKSSINNLTYFYNRQIFIHNTLLAFKISTSMNDGDLAKRIIVEKILAFGFRTNNNFDLKTNKENV